jgi:uncharacterized protein (DUF58 family)
MQAFYQSLFFRPRLFILLAVVVGVCMLAFLQPSLLSLGQVSALLLLLLLVVDLLLLYLVPGGLSGQRELPNRLSNGDLNPVTIALESSYPFGIAVRLIDEAPYQFQLRHQQHDVTLAAQGRATWQYELRPVYRGEYHFGAVNAFVSSPLGLARRRFRFDQDQMVPTYPSYLQMRQYQLLAISNRLTEVGVKKIRRLGHTTEFEQIKEYVSGDDYRTINWKATARSDKLMVNQYTDERAQHVYCLIDKSRVMKMPFEGMTLMDYAINASLVLANIAMYRNDKAGLITFAEQIHHCLPASNRPLQMSLIMEALYNQETDFLEADYERLYVFLKRKLTTRSLLLLFTNFESLSGLERQLSYLQAINRNHLLVVIFFENTELRQLAQQPARSTEDIYHQAIGEDFAFQKKRIAKELEQHGIITIFTAPSQLTINTLNRYLELKARGMV